MRKVLVILTMCLAFTVNAMAQLTVTGRVTGEDGLGIPGASVLEQGTTNGTVTNSLDGNYSLRVADNATLVFSGVRIYGQPVSTSQETSYGPGYPRFIANAGQDDDGWIWHDTNGDGVGDTRGHIGTNLNFGPAFDGTTQVMAWDGIIRPWEAQMGHYASLFQSAVSNNATIAMTMGGENSNSRVALTRQDNTGVSLNSKNVRNIANINSSFNLGKKYSIDFSLNYINQITENRPFMVDRLWNNFGGMMTRFDNAEWYLPRYQTSLGYRHVVGRATQSLTPDENIIYSGFRPDIFDYLWNVNRVKLDEFSDRVIGNLTNTWQVTNDFKIRGRIATDFTSMKTESRNPNTIPLTFGNSGGFSLQSYLNKILYGDVLATYTKKLVEDLIVSASAGYTTTREENQTLSRSTNGGLSTENLFDIAATVNTPNSGSSRSQLLKDAYLGMLNFDYKSFLFLEGTIRRDRTSTMHPDRNAFVYPSVNSSFLFSEAFNMPGWIEYGKVRASWGVVGNYPDMYRANIAYNQNTLGIQSVGGRPILYTTLPMSFGNDGIRPEEKHEVEFGLETSFLKNRLGLDVSYYNAQIRDQILGLTVPSSSGATSVLTNIGTLRNKGIEVAIKGTPLQTRDINWNMTLNLSQNKNIVEKTHRWCRRTIACRL
jgi:iron complex outermembrane recepter protein